VLGSVADVVRDRLHAVGGVREALRREVYAPAGEVGLRRLTHLLGETARERGAREMDLACRGSSTASLPARRTPNAEAISRLWWSDPKAFERAFSGVAAA
jgi:hypothetical protein